MINKIKDWVIKNIFWIIAIAMSLCLVFIAVTFIEVNPTIIGVSALLGEVIGMCVIAEVDQ